MYQITPHVSAVPSLTAAGPAASVVACPPPPPGQYGSPGLLAVQAGLAHPVVRADVHQVQVAEHAREVVE